MKNVVILSLVLPLGPFAFSQGQPSAAESAPLLLVQEIPLPHVEGRIDNFTFDAKRKRVIGAALGINTRQPYMPRVLSPPAGREQLLLRPQR